MQEKTIGIRDYWKEIIIILLLGIASFCIFFRFTFFPKGILGIFLFPLPASIIGGYLIAKKKGGNRYAVTIPAVMVVVSVIAVSIYHIITFLNMDAPGKAIAGKFISLILYGPIVFISGLIGAWIGKRIESIFTKS